MYKTVIFFFLLLFMGIEMFAQEEKNTHWDIALEMQQYPTGIIPGFKVAFGFKDKHAVHLRLGANIFDHKDFGVQQNEQGEGVGFSVGYEYFFRSGQKGFFIGPRTDIWFNEVRWQDILLSPSNGTSDIVVMQPTAMVGYLFKIGENIFVTPTIGMGFEINVVTKGAETGQGLIGLWGLQFGYRL